MPRKFSQLSLRDLLLVGLPLLVLIVAAFWAASRFIKPAPPDRVVMSAGGESGAYLRYGMRYRDFLARYGIDLVVRQSSGSMENLERLRDPASDVEIGFIQGGTARIGEDDALSSLGDFYHEPLWVFYRAALSPGRPLERISELKGARVAVGSPGSGTRHLALELLAAHGLDGDNTRFIDRGGLDLVAALAVGEVDAVFAVGPPVSGLVWSLLYADGVSLMSLSHADAYVRRMPHLTHLVLPRGAIDLARDIPARDVNLVAPTATLMVREDIHPALVDLLMQAATEVHGGPGVFQRPGEFPRAGHSDFPLSKEAERYYKSGKPFLQRYLPFWAATLIDRMVVMLLPLIAVLVPLFRFAPSLYGWRVRSRIYRYYGELKFLESAIEESPGAHSREEWMKKLDAIETEVNHLSTPLAFADMYYQLRAHIDLVRANLQRLPASG